MTLDTLFQDSFVYSLMIYILKIRVALSSGSIFRSRDRDSMIKETHDEKRIDEEKSR